MAEQFASETVPIAEAQRFDEAAFDCYLRDEAGASLVSLRQMSGGQSNPTFLVETSEGEMVLRKKPPGKLLPSAHAVDREYRVLRALADTGLPVPRALHFCDDVGVIGTAFYLMERLRGRVFTDPLLGTVPKAERQDYYFAVAETLASLHAIDWRAVGLEGFGKADGYYPRHVARWSDSWAKSKTRENPALDRLAEWLPRNLPAPEAAAIFHGDYRLGNVMFHPTQPRIIGVLDWELATLGPPSADLAHNCIAYFLPADNPNSIMGQDLNAFGIPDEHSYLDRYCAARGTDERPTAFHRAFALFRLAVICEGILSRAKDGTASNASALDVGARGIAIAERSWEVAVGGR